MSEVHCPTCHGLVEHRIATSSQGPYCAKCGFLAVTTYVPPIVTDRGIYSIHVTGGDPANLKHVKAVSSIREIGFLAARKLLGMTMPEVFSGSAYAVLKHKLKLQDAGIECEIHPSFPYEDDDPALGRI